jgi:hypothetical protein
MDIFAPDSPAAPSDSPERAAANARQILNILNFAAPLFAKNRGFPANHIQPNRCISAARQSARPSVPFKKMSAGPSSAIARVDHAPSRP